MPRCWPAGLVKDDGGSGRPAGYERAISLNDHGIAVGGSRDVDPSDGEFASYWDNDNVRYKIEAPHTLDQNGYLARSINNNGVVIGTDARYYSHRWKYDMKAPTSLTQLTESKYGSTTVSSITEGGMVFGYADYKVNFSQRLYRPLVWDVAGNLYDINEYTKAKDYDIGSGINSDLNDHRLLVATKRDKNNGLPIGAAILKSAVFHTTLPHQRCE